MKRILLLSIITLAFSNLQAQNKQELSKFNKQSQQHGFIENKGQIHDQNYKANPTVKYLLSLGNGLNVQLKSNSFSYDTYRTEVKERKKDSLQALMHPKEHIEQDVTFCFHRVDVELLGAKENPIIVAEEPSADYLNYYNAVTPEEGATMVRSYKKVTYKNIYNGIDLEFVAQASKAKPVEYNFIVHPGADAKQIQIKYNGANGTKLAEEKINIEVAHGTMSESIPASWLQESKQKLNITYNTIIENTYGFNIPNYNPSQTLIIDPNPDLVWATYYGGDGYDCCKDIKIDSIGNIYISGTTFSLTSIATLGSYQSTPQGFYDAFFSKFNSNGFIEWGTYFGGSNWDEFSKIAIDKNGNLNLIGKTVSNNCITTTGAHQPTIGGAWDVFVAQFNFFGLINWATYFGGDGIDFGNSIVCDYVGNIYITGSTASTTDIATPLSYQTVYGGSSIFLGDAFIAKFNKNGVRQWATYYGGARDDSGWDVVLDSDSNIIICGETMSIAEIATVTSHQPTIGSTLVFNGFLVKFDYNGMRQWSTYYSGSDGDGTRCLSLICDTSNNIYCVGGTCSTYGIATLGSHQILYGGGLDDGFGDAFLVKFNQFGVRQWGTYYGGSQCDDFSDITMDCLGNLYIVGNTISSDSISTSNAYQTFYSGGTAYDATIVKFNNSGVLQWGTYFGGTNDDRVFGIVCDTTTNLYFTGYTKSSSGISIPGVYQATYGGNDDAFIAKFTYCNMPNTPVITQVGVNLQSSATSGNQWYNQDGLIAGATAQTFAPIIDGDYFVIVSDGQCVSDTSNVITVVNAGISQTETYQAIKISPNPVKDLLNIEVLQEKSKQNFEITNAVGTIVYKGVLQNNMQISTTNFANGMYFLKLENGSVYKFVKE